MDTFEVSKEHNGKTYTAKATVDKGMLTVSSPLLGSKTTSTSSNNESLANIILGELIRSNERGR